MTRRFLISFLLIFLSSSAPAEEAVVAPSLEWMARSAPIILRGKVQSVSKQMASAQTPLWTIETVMFKVTETLKGATRPSQVVFRRLRTVQTSATEWMMEESDLIVFLDKGEKSTDNIDLSGSLTLKYELPFAPINLSRLSANALIYDDFKVNYNGDEILQIIKNEVAASADGLLASETVAIPESTEASRAVCEKKDPCFLIVVNQP